MRVVGLRVVRVDLHRALELAQGVLDVAVLLRLDAQVVVDFSALVLLLRGSVGAAAEISRSATADARDEAGQGALDSSGGELGSGGLRTRRGTGPGW